MKIEHFQAEQSNKKSTKMLSPKISFIQQNIVNFVVEKESEEQNIALMTL